MKQSRPFPSPDIMPPESALRPDSELHRTVARLRDGVPYANYKDALSITGEVEVVNLIHRQFPRCRIFKLSEKVESTWGFHVDLIVALESGQYFTVQVKSTAANRRASVKRDHATAWLHDPVPTILAEVRLTPSFHLKDLRMAYGIETLLTPLGRRQQYLLTPADSSPESITVSIIGMLECWTALQPGLKRIILAPERATHQLLFTSIATLPDWGNNARGFFTALREPTQWLQNAIDCGAQVPSDELIDAITTHLWNRLPASQIARSTAEHHLVTAVTDWCQRMAGASSADTNTLLSGLRRLMSIVAAGSDTHLTLSILDRNFTESLEMILNLDLIPRTVISQAAQRLALRDDPNLSRLGLWLLRLCPASTEALDAIERHLHTLRPLLSHLYRLSPHDLLHIDDMMYHQAFRLPDLVVRLESLRSHSEFQAQSFLREAVSEYYLRRDDLIDEAIHRTKLRTGPLAEANLLRLMSIRR